MANPIDRTVDQLVAYGLGKGLIQAEDRVWARNSLLALLDKNDYEEGPLPPSLPDLPAILSPLTEYAVAEGLIHDDNVSRDLFDTRLMGVLTPRPGQVVGAFRERQARSPREATDWFYALAGDTNYIRRDRIAKDRKWQADTPYGPMDITINLSKPEKDPRAIAALLKKQSTAYPKCQLCRENEGYAGRMDHPARQNLRMIPLNLGGEEWFLQYSPYVYYNEHCILLNGRHTPMKVDADAFRRLLEFVTLFPHYFMGSNAALPVVGGSILDHDHFQGGRYTFPIEGAEALETLELPGWEGVKLSVLRWPMTVLRLVSGDREALLRLAAHIGDTWRDYTDEEAFIFAETGGEPHNAITPIARRRGEDYELDLVLRNNITTEELPLGRFHTPPSFHHIKRENIGLIEVMGLAVLPSRLKGELAALEEGILTGADLEANPLTAAHAPWARELMARRAFTRENAGAILEQEVGLAFAKALEHCAVLPDPRGLRRFLEAL